MPVCCVMPRAGAFMRDLCFVLCLVMQITVGYVHELNFKSIFFGLALPVHFGTGGPPLFPQQIQPPVFIAAVVSAAAEADLAAVFFCRRGCFWLAFTLCPPPPPHRRSRRRRRSFTAVVSTAAIVSAAAAADLAATVPAATTVVSAAARSPISPPPILLPPPLFSLALSPPSSPPSSPPPFSQQRPLLPPPFLSLIYPPPVCRRPAVVSQPVAVLAAAAADPAVILQLDQHCADKRGMPHPPLILMRQSGASW